MLCKHSSNKSSNNSLSELSLSAKHSNLGHTSSVKHLKPMNLELDRSDTRSHIGLDTDRESSNMVKLAFQALRAQKC